MGLTALQTRLREATAEYIDVYDQVRQQGVCAGLYDEIDASMGFFKAAAAALMGQPEEFTGTATVNQVDSSAATFLTKFFMYTLGIQVDELAKTDAISRGAITRKLRGMAVKAIGHIDRRLTALLITGETGGNFNGGASIASTPFFSATSAIVGGGTINNIFGTSVSGSAAEVLAALWGAEVRFLGFRGPGNDLMTNGRPRIALMYDSGATNGIPIHNSVMDAINPQLLNDKARFPNVEPRPNPYLGGSVADLWAFNLDAAVKAFALGWQQKPDFRATIGQNDSDVILNNRNLIQTTWGYEVAFGSNLAAVLLNDA